jgi:hypothetical protein
VTATPVFLCVCVHAHFIFLPFFKKELQIIFWLMPLSCWHFAWLMSVSIENGFHANFLTSARCQQLARHSGLVLHQHFLQNILPCYLMHWPGSSRLTDIGWLSHSLIHYLMTLFQAVQWIRQLGFDSRPLLEPFVVDRVVRGCVCLWLL